MLKRHAQKVTEASLNTKSEKGMTLRNALKMRFSFVKIIAKSARSEKQRLLQGMVYWVVFFKYI